MVNELKGKSEFLTKCRNCGNISSNQCSYNEIQLSLNKRTLDDGLRELLKSEDLSGANKYMCDRCNQLSDATREFKFSKLPKVLKFQLLRFAYDPYTGNRKKISSQFSFPMILDMNQFLDSSMYFFSFLFLLSAFCLLSFPSFFSFSNLLSFFLSFLHFPFTSLFSSSFFFLPLSSLPFPPLVLLLSLATSFPSKAQCLSLASLILFHFHISLSKAKNLTILFLIPACFSSIIRALPLPYCQIISFLFKLLYFHYINIMINIHYDTNQS